MDGEMSSAWELRHGLKGGCVLCFQPKNAAVVKQVYVQTPGQKIPKPTVPKASKKKPDIVSNLHLSHF